MDNPRVGYTPRLGSTREGEIQALAAVYAFVIRCHEQKKAAEAEGGQKGDEHGSVGSTSSEAIADDGEHVQTSERVDHES